MNFEALVGHFNPFPPRRRTRSRPPIRIEALETRVLLTDTTTGPNNSLLSATVVPVAEFNGDDGFFHSAVTDDLFAGDAQDYFRFNAQGPGDVRIDLTGLSDDLQFKVYNARGVELRGTVNNPGTADESFRLTLKGFTEQEFYIQVLAGAAGAQSAYNLDVVYETAGRGHIVLDADNADAYPNDSLTMFGVIQDLVKGQATPMHGDVGGNDPADFVRIRGGATSTRNVTVTMAGLNKDLDLEIESATGRRIAISQRPGKTSETVKFAAKPGVYYFIKIFSKGRRSSSPYDLNIQY